MIVTSSRRATIDELAAECDRRGEVIDRLQAELAALRIAADQMTEREKVVAVTRLEVMRLMREDFDPTPNGWEGRDWHDNAEETADKIIATVLSESPPHVSDSWRAIKQWLSDYAAEEAAFSHYSDDVLLDGVMTAGTMRALNDALYVAAEAEHRRLERGDHSSAKPASPTPDTSHA